jgi:4-amino-4-deoxy-L-arabinose transferase-like glycosyltransferase
MFVGVTCFWLSQDRSIPVYDAGIHLSSAISAYEALSSGRLLRALTAASAPYPPLASLVGVLGVLVGGVDVAPPIIALNVVFVPLLALGCYKVARLAFGPSAGLLAVVFALGSPLVIEEFHEFMLDAPEAAMAAIAVWAILATEHFSRLRVSALAGLAVGLGMLSKETFVFFVAGVAAATAIRGGRRAWRGIGTFVAVVLLTAMPWYLYELSTIHDLTSEAFASSTYTTSLPIFPGVAPPRLSSANLEWYLWSFINVLLYLPLFAFSAAGLLWAILGLARRRPVAPFSFELAFGALISWAALTETYLHDVRYAIPMIVYFAVFGVGWVSRLPRPGRAVMAAALALVALANWLGVGFGVGRSVMTKPVSLVYEQEPGNFTLTSTLGLWIGPPQRNGQMLALLRGLRRNGVREIWVSGKESEIEYSYPGMLALARIAQLDVTRTYVDPVRASPTYAVLSRHEPEADSPIPCIRLENGAGVWVRLGGFIGPEAWGYCPVRAV